MRIGVLALQGDVEEHVAMLRKCMAEPVLVRMPEDMAGISGLIIPGGESTTIGKLLVKSGLGKAIAERAGNGMPVYGTCAGAILLAKNIVESEQPTLGLIDISVKRNDYGRQIDSFETDIEIKDFEKPFRAVFIRAPVIFGVRNGVNILAVYNDKPVLLRRKNILVSTFHPELSNDKRVHELFLGMVNNCIGI